MKEFHFIDEQTETLRSYQPQAAVLVSQGARFQTDISSFANKINPVENTVSEGWELM